MSIVNISSENLKSGNDADFEVQLKKTMMRAIGVQVLNVTVPLTYYTINRDDNTLSFCYTNVGGQDAEDSIEITPGNYTADELAYEMTKQFGIFTVNRIFLREQYDLHAEAYSALIKIGNRDFETGPGEFNSNSGNTVEFSIDTSSGLFWADGGGFTGTAPTDVGSDYAAPYVLVVYDEIKDHFIFGQNTITEFSINGSGLVNDGLSYYVDTLRDGAALDKNSERILKLIGLNNKMSIISQSNTPAINNKYGGMGSAIIKSYISPEISGPSMLYMRLGGDPLLDQQNTETNFHDRIPIPIDQPHGGVVHYENDSQADVIPFTCPCDVSRITIRIEAGDTNEVIGGPTSNLRGHHTYVRLKFYFGH